ncbi:MAG: radical SAM protein [Ferruginibacter sp.]
MLQSLSHTYKRYRSLQTHVITALPVAILMPHSACNCRCVMCDIWKGNNRLKQLSENDISGILHTLKQLGTRHVLMSGGEALMHPLFFSFCALLKNAGIKISLHSTGLLLGKHARDIVQWTDDVIISLDGDEHIHNSIRNVPAGFQKMRAGIQTIKEIEPGFKISARTVIHKSNFRIWPALVKTAKDLGLSSISFLPADVTSHAFNREQSWGEAKQHEIVPAVNELDEFKTVLENLVVSHAEDFSNGFIAESPAKLYKIYEHYAAFYQLALPPFKKCNAPWVSVVVEADGAVRPCFFHAAYGNIHDAALEDIINSEKAVAFRKQLDTSSNITCVNCVCYLHLKPGIKP